MKNYTGKLFLVLALAMLVVGLFIGVLAAHSYILPGIGKNSFSFTQLRPMHVSAAVFWILSGAIGGVYCALGSITQQKPSRVLSIAHVVVWVLGIVGVFYAYCTGKFGGREYWEFDPIFALPIACAWLIFLIQFIQIVKNIGKWPVYIWMWMTGIVFFLFTFTENYLWIFPYFREHFVTDMTIQWKVNGSLVGSWNQMIYGTAFFLMERISGDSKPALSRTAFVMYFLGLFNLMFNWGHHIYTLPTVSYVRWIGYAVSMTEWIFLARILYNWKQSLSEMQKHYSRFSYRFIMAADVWVFINMGQAMLMSIPALNLYTHGTHVTVAHAMGTTIGINSMILMGACSTFLADTCYAFLNPHQIK
jgi:nitric oxide reductase subunit B